jgi:hypothetical protein
VQDEAWQLVCCSEVHVTCLSVWELARLVVLGISWLHVCAALLDEGLALANCWRYGPDAADRLGLVVAANASGCLETCAAALANKLEMLALLPSAVAALARHQLLGCLLLLARRTFLLKPAVVKLVAVSGAGAIGKASS